MAISCTPKVWISTLRTTWQDRAVKRTTSVPRLWAGICILHPDCVWVATGSSLQHYPWQQTDPVKLAEDLFEKLFASG
jgi:hypothetical protein